MANPCSNRKESALPEGNKVNTCVQECLRRFKHTSRDLRADKITKTMTKYMGKLAQGGYPYNWRKEVLSSALKGYVKIWELERLGKGHVNKPEGTTATKRRVNRLVGKSTWFAKTKKKDEDLKHPNLGLNQRSKSTLKQKRKN